LVVLSPEDFSADELPEGFSSASKLLEKYLARPEIAARMAGARLKLEKGNEKRVGYEPGLAGLRRRAGLSQADLAERIGTSQPAISLYESGEREPTLKVMRALAEALGVDFNTLLPSLT